ncbi:MAG TPA: hypothetical protein PLV45_06130 [bacterium]|nr:hypothetical protein [bacterium]
MTWIRKYISSCFIGFFLLISGCAKHCIDDVDSTSCCYNLSRDGFLQELLFIQGTTRTPEFDDYTPGSYHVEKLDLLAGVMQLREKDEPVTGALILGPLGPLWAYNAVLFVERDRRIHANWLHFPHARITYKGTRRLTRNEYIDFLDAITRSPVVSEGIPGFETLRCERNPDLPLEWHYDLLIADWSTGTMRTWHTVADQMEFTPDEVDSYVNALIALMEDDTATYSTDLPDGYETWICPK